jgi:PcfJ-like protein
MGKKIKLREAQRRAAEHAIAARLRAHSGAKKRPGFITCYSEFPERYRGRIERYRLLAVRNPDLWQSGVRARSLELRFLDLVRFTFGDYSVPLHLANTWLTNNQGHVGAPAGDDEGATRAADFRRWYITIAQGGSLYRAATHRYMSRLETHHFVNTPDDVAATQRAFWYAFARAQTEDVAAALRVARSKLVDFSVVSPLWQDAARFFARNPTTVLEMNDLIDYIRAASQEDDRFSFARRTLAALRRRMAEWHLERREIVRGIRWSGHRLPNMNCQIDGEGGRGLWRFRQIKTEVELFREGQRMEHCVASYRDLCATGSVSIWSVTCEAPDGTTTSRLTVELRHDGTIAQCRGYRNGPPTREEAAIIRRWAAERKLTLNAHELGAA